MIKKSLINHDLLNFCADNHLVLTRSSVKGVISYVLEHERWDLCSWHPQGFLKIKLGQTMLNGIITEVQVNIWSAKNRYPQTDPSICHSHNGRLRSYILYGEIDNRQYRVQEKSNQRYALYKVNYEKSSSKSKNTKQQVSCVLVDSTIHPAGEKYSVDSGEFHSTHVQEGTLACTLVYRHRDLDYAAYNVRKIGKEEVYAFDRQIVEKQKLIAALYEVIDTIAPYTPIIPNPF